MTHWKVSVLVLLITLCFCACNEEASNRSKLVESCLTSIKASGNINAMMAAKYCKCAADTLLTVFSLDELQGHLELEEKEKYDLYLPYTQKCILELANSNVLMEEE